MLNLLLFLTLVSYQSYAQILFEDNFENKTQSIIFSRFSKLKDQIEIIQDIGVNGTAGLRITYHGNEEGSQRIVAIFNLNQATMEASLSYDIKFEEDFQFVKGGKLHGLGPTNPITGGMPMMNSGWSSRVMFEENGGVATYLYHQNKSGIYGETTTADNFRFEKNKFYALTLYTKLNSSPTKSDGNAQIYIDGKLIIEQGNIQFRKSESKESHISTLLFSTFHGGHEPSWAPRDENGNFKNVHAVFDNFLVEAGFKVRKRQGQ